MDCKSIIFDLDGTLVDSYPGIEASARAAWEAVQPDSAFPSLRPFLGPPIREMFQRAKPELNEANLNLLVKAFREAYDGGGWKKTVPFAGVVETLTVLHKKRVPLFGVTNKPKLPTHLILENCGIHLFFRVRWEQGCFRSCSQ